MVNKSYNAEFSRGSPRAAGTKPRNRTGLVSTLALYGCTTPLALSASLNKDGCGRASVRVPAYLDL